MNKHTHHRLIFKPLNRRSSACIGGSPWLCAVVAACPLVAPGTFPTCAQSAPPGAVDGDGAATSSLMVTTPLPPPAPDKRETPSALREVSLFALPPIEPRKFEQHDLVQIIVRETSKAVSSHELETKKKFDLDGQV